MGVGYNPRIVTNGLVGYWDAGNTKSYSGSGTTWSDLSGNNFDLTTYNSPTHNNKIFSFNGTNQYAGRSPIFTPFAAATSITIDTWITFNSNNVNRYILAVGKDSGDLPAGKNGGMALLAYGFSSVSNYIVFEFGSGYGRVTSGFVPTTGIWYNISVTTNGTNTIMYINGALVNSASQTTGAVSNTPAVSLGSYLDASGNAGVYWHNGNIAATRFYNRALSAQEVSQNFNALRGRYGI